MPDATILLADDDAGIRTVLDQALTREGYAVRTATNAAGLWQLVSAGAGNLIVTDVVLPDQNAFDLLPRIKELRPELPIVVMSARNNILTAIAAAESGAYEYLPKPFDLRELTSVVQRALAAPSKGAANDTDNAQRLPLIGRSAAMQEIYRVIARVTQTDLTVMISGESGTGKELVARVLHDYGKRRERPFVAVNMAAIPRELVESELFGHERGAFTGAVTRGPGRFEQAEGGTLFLDEIGDMPMEAQTRLLRVLQQGEYMSVGGRVAIRTDVRIIAATNKDLHNLIQHGLFREDLFYRLNVVPLRMPPLRERMEDVADLAQHVLAKARAQGLPAKQFDPGAVERLKAYDWPGNVRELENLVCRLTVLTTGDTIDAGAVNAELNAASRVVAADENAGNLSSLVERHLKAHFSQFGGHLPPSGLYDRVITDIERPLISIALDAARGNQIRAAQLLGLNRNTLRKKLRELGIDAVRGARLR